MHVVYYDEFPSRAVFKRNENRGMIMRKSSSAKQKKHTEVTDQIGLDDE